MTVQEVSLYFHIPFCTRKCGYCHFYVVPDKESFKTLLMEGLFHEIEMIRPLLHDKKIVTVYFGGGTPSLLGAGRLHALLTALPSLESCAEITLEANPENVTLELMRDYRMSGVNRVSIGIQSFDEGLLNTLQRTHSAQKGIEAVHLTAKAGIENLSVDLMYDLPLQTLASWTHTLDTLQGLPIQHLSLYNLIIEPQSAFFKYQDRLKPQVPSEEASLMMYESAVEALEKLGLHQYEISAFAKKGKRSIHNSGYWTGRPFLGLGPSAFSFWEGKRFRNVANLNRYYQKVAQRHSPIDFQEELPLHSRQRELLAIHLRLLEGVDLDAFQQKFGQLENTLRQELEHLAGADFLVFDQQRLRLSKKGRLFYDTIASEII